MHFQQILLQLLCIGLLAGCATTEADDPRATSSSSIEQKISSSKSPAVSQKKPVEKFPEVPSLEYFSQMRMEGTDLVLGKVLAQNEAYVRHYITYKSNGVKISGILNIPKGDGPFPLLILNHGHIDPAIYTNGRGLKREQDYLARQGFAVLHTDYRKHAESDPDPDEREVYDGMLAYSIDSLNAINAMRAAKIAKIDTEHVGMMGHSMGGGVTLNIATMFPQMIDAAVLYAPVSSDAWQNFDRWRSERPKSDITLEFFGGNREENPTAWDAISTKKYLDRVTAPIHLFHGTADKDVPIEWSDDLDRLLRDAGKSITYTVYQGEGHEYGPKWTDFMEKTSAFFKENL